MTGWEMTNKDMTAAGARGEQRELPRRYHAAVWTEPLVTELGGSGRRGVFAPSLEPEIQNSVSDVETLVPIGGRRRFPPKLPELSEWDVLRHYLRLSQQTLGMMGISLFGTCTMKYNPTIGESCARHPGIREVHPRQDVRTMQGMLEMVNDLEVILCELSGMDSFVFQPGGGADAAWLHVCIARAYHADRGELMQRDEVVTTAQAHPCNAATAAAAGFKVVTLPLEESGYPSLDALKAAVSERTATLMVNNPDDMGIYNPEIMSWVEVVHDAGGLCFYDHANFNGVMGKIRAADLGFDACMFMLHKTFGAPKGGGGPAVGAYGCTPRLASYLPGPHVVRRENGFYDLEEPTRSVGRVREFLGNLPQVLKAYVWARAMGTEGIHQAADLSVLASNYMDSKLRKIRGISRSHPHLEGTRMEMVRYSLASLASETGVSVVDVQHRMTDFGIDGMWLSHEPWIVPEPFTPEAGESYSKEDIDEWVAVLAHVCEEAYRDPELVRSAPHNQVIHRIDPTVLHDPERWATTWRAYQRKNAHG